MPYATYRFNKIIAAETIRFIVTVAIVVYKGLKLVVYRMLTTKKRAQSNEIDMLNGPLFKKILLFALPLAASSLLQELFNSVDVAVV